MHLLVINTQFFFLKYKIEKKSESVFTDPFSSDSAVTLPCSQIQCKTFDFSFSLIKHRTQFKLSVTLRHC